MISTDKVITSQNLADLGTSDGIECGNYFPPMKINFSNNTYIPVTHKTKYIDYYLHLCVDPNGRYSIKIEINTERNKIKSRSEILEVE